MNEKQEDIIKPGSAVVTNTMLVRAARFVAERGHTPQAIEAFFDFCSLVDAAVLRRRLLTLEGDLLGDNAEFASSALLAGLRRAGVLVENSVGIDPNDVQKALCLIVGTDRVFNRLDIRGMSVYVTDMLPEAFPDETHSRSTNDPLEPERYCFMMLARHASAGEVLRRQTNVFRFFRGDDFLEFLRGTGDQERGGYVLRTYLYSRSAWRSKLTFIPDYPRVPFLEGLLDEIHRCVVSEGYELLAKRLGFEADDFLADARPIGLPLPPFTSILLSRCTAPEDIAGKLFELRDEFSDLRESLATLEEERAASLSIKERNKIRKRVAATFSAVARRFDINGGVVLKDVLDYAGDAAEPMFDWSNPTSYRASLLTKPYEWVRDWWLRRPFAQFFHIAKEFRRIKEYNSLVQKVFGVEFEDEDIERFRSTATRIQEAFHGARTDG